MLECAASFVSLSLFVLSSRRSLGINNDREAIGELKTNQVYQSRSHPPKASIRQ